MAFNLQKVLRALLFSSSQALSIKDVQDIFARFHDQAPTVVETDEETPSVLAPIQTEATEPAEAPQAPATITANEPQADPDAPSLKPAELLAATPSDEQSEVVVQTPEDTDAELYQDVPTLITAAQIREAMDNIAGEMRASNDIYMLIEGPTGYRLMTHPRYARWIRIMRDEPPPVKLSQSALETLAVVAYRQPVTRSEIENIRGVSAEAGLSKLMERELVYITGRADLPGRPLQYGTTDKFLEFVGVKSLVELPASDVLSPRQIDAWLQNASKVTPPADADMGLPLEEGEGASPNLDSVSVEHTVPPFETPSDVSQTVANETSEQAAPPVQRIADVEAESENEIASDSEKTPASEEPRLDATDGSESESEPEKTS